MVQIQARFKQLTFIIFYCQFKSKFQFDKNILISVISAQKKSMSFVFLDPELITALRLVEISHQNETVQAEYIDRIRIQEMNPNQIYLLALNSQMIGQTVKEEIEFKKRLIRCIEYHRQEQKKKQQDQASRRKYQRELLFQEEKRKQQIAFNKLKLQQLEEERQRALQRLLKPNLGNQKQKTIAPNKDSTQSLTSRKIPSECNSFWTSLQRLWERYSWRNTPQWGKQSLPAGSSKQLEQSDSDSQSSRLLQQTTASSKGSEIDKQGRWVD